MVSATSDGITDATGLPKASIPYWLAAVRSPNVLAAFFVVIGCLAVTYSNAKLFFVEFTLARK
jgi:hypothetical protein